MEDFVGVGFGLWAAVVVFSVLPLELNQDFLVLQRVKGGIGGMSASFEPEQQQNLTVNCQKDKICMIKSFFLHQKELSITKFNKDSHKDCAKQMESIQKRWDFQQEDGSRNHINSGENDRMTTRVKLKIWHSQRTYRNYRLLQWHNF